MPDNTEYDAKLIHYMAENQIPARHLVFNQSCHSVAEAAQAAGVKREDFIKSVCFLAGETLVVAIVKGEDRASSRRVARICEAEAIRPAEAAEMLTLTGYPCGGTPPFGYPAKFLIDEKVLKQEWIYAGGGSETSLICLRSNDLARANQGSIVRIRS